MSSYSHFSDKELIDAILRGDAPAAAWLFAEMLPRYIQPMLSERFAHLPVGPEDLAQDLYEQLRRDDWQNLRQFDGRSSLKTWLHVIAYRTAHKKYNLKRLKGFKGFAPLNELALAVDPDTEDLEMKRAALLELVGQLTNRRERQMLLYYMDGYATEEIARLLDASPNAVHTIKSRAISHLKELAFKTSFI